MKTRFFFLICVALVLSISFPRVGNMVVAQDGEPPVPTRRPPIPPEIDGPRYPFGEERDDPIHLKKQPAGGAPAEGLPQEGLNPQTVGGPDEFGYIWNDSVAMNWIDATAGTDTGLIGDSRYNAAGPISLPFTFRFYEEVYNQVWISGFGYLSFNDYYYWPSQQNPLPSSQTPNNVIAPFWTVTYLQNNMGNGKVYYYSGGIAPNRYFVVEWHNVQGGTVYDSSGGDENYRFEVVLYENGDILFQYHTMTYNDWRYYASIGIEDARGNGLGYMDWNNYWSRIPYSNRAVRFYRPAPSARVSIYQLYQGEFNQPGGSSKFTIPVRNTGELGTDTYDLSVSSIWPVELYADDGITPLTDTDADGVVDTGPVSQGTIRKFVAKVNAPDYAAIGNANNASVTVTSSLNPSKSKTVILQSAIPTSFAQVYRDDYDGKMSLYLVQPGGQQEKHATSQDWYGYAPAVAEAPNGNFILTWTKGRCLDDNCNIYVSEIEYALLNKYGETVLAVTRLTNLSSATSYMSDEDPIVAIAPNGRIGILWYRYQYQYTDRDYWLSNVYMAILDASGNLLYGPANLTNNVAWYYSGALDIPMYYNPRLVATGDNRFILAWEKEMRKSSSCTNDCYLEDIFYAAKDTNGGSVLSPTQFTADTWGTSNWEGYYSPNLAALSNNRALLTWSRNSDYDVYYAVIDSAGNVVKDKTNLSQDSYAYGDQYSDAAQLSDGKISVAWTGYQSTSRIRYGILDAGYNKVFGPATLNNTAAPRGDNRVSVTADQAGRAILTWMDEDYNNRRNLYYALVSSGGSLVTSPMIFRMGEGSYPYIETSNSGYGNTTYSSTISANPDGALMMTGAWFGGPPGGAASIPVRYTNHGQAKAENITLTVALSGGLLYLGDTSGITPTLGAGTVSWNLPDLQFLEENAFMLYLGVPNGAAIGDLFPVTFTLAVTNESNASDNTFNTNVMAAVPVYLPLIGR